MTLDRAILPRRDESACTAGDQAMKRRLRVAGHAAPWHNTCVSRRTAAASLRRRNRIDPTTMLRTGLDRLYLWAGYAAGFFLVLIFLLMMALSVGREIGINVPSGDDFAAWSMAACAFLGLAHTFRNGDMIRVGLVVDRLSGRTRHAFEVFSLVIGLGFSAYFTWHALVLTVDSWRFNDMSQGVVAIPLWLPQLGYSLGLAILSVAFVDEFVHVVLRGGSPRYEKPPPASAEEVIERAVQSGI